MDGTAFFRAEQGGIPNFVRKMIVGLAVSGWCKHWRRTHDDGTDIPFMCSDWREVELDGFGTIRHTIKENIVFGGECTLEERFRTGNLFADVSSSGLETISAQPCQDSRSDLDGSRELHVVAITLDGLGVDSDDSQFSVILAESVGTKLTRKFMNVGRVEFPFCITIGFDPTTFGDTVVENHCRSCVFRDGR